jgi:hypothetical protein
VNEYRVPKERADVLVAIPPHPPEPRTVLLSTFAQSHHGAETPSDLFNVGQAFVPLFRDDGELVLARREAIAWVLVSEPARSEWYYYETRTGVPSAAVHLQFDNDMHLDGELALVGPAGGQRVADLVNRTEGFLHLERGEELFLVNLRRVVAITLRKAIDAGA